MNKKVHRAQRGEESLSLERIVEAATAILDHGGEAGLTFRLLSETLATGPGAIYWHVANKHELVIAACDAIVVRTIASHARGATPEEVISGLADGMFAAMSRHPWIGMALVRAAGQGPVLRIFEQLGQQIRLMGVPAARQRMAVSVLLSYILGEGGQEAANSQLAQEQALDRSTFLTTLSSAWLQLDEAQYPFTRSVAEQLPTHDDRADFLAGVGLIIGGLLK